MLKLICKLPNNDSFFSDKLFPDESRSYAAAPCELGSQDALNATA
jgi:hypothetical protein